MKNNTKVRLHLSKQLFESLTKEIIKEAKANDGYTVAVKQPKMPKQSKAQAASPEVQKTDKEAMMGEDMQAQTPDQEKKVKITLDEWTGAEGTAVELGKWAIEHFPSLAKIGTSGDMGQTAADIGQAIMGIAGAGSIFVSLALAAHKDEIKAAAKKLISAVKGGVKEGAEGVDPELAKIAAELPQDVKAKIAKQGGDAAPAAGAEKLNEISSEEVAALVGLLPAVGLSAAYIKDVLRTMKAKGLKGREGWKKASQEVGSDVKAHMDRTVGGNTPGQGHGVDISKTFGPQNEKKEKLKEYEHHYEMVNGQCRRYNDEGEYTVVSMSYCR